MTKAIRTTLLALFAAALCTVGTQAWSAESTDYWVISADGKTVVLQDQAGAAKQYTLPVDINLTVDGKTVAAADLQPGMHATGTIAASTPGRAVHVTTVKMGTVVSQTGRSVTFKEESGQIHRFTQSEADERGMQIYMEGKPVRVSNLQPGDQVSATVISEGAPEVLTAQALDESLAAAGESAKGGASTEPAPAAAPLTAPAPTAAAAVEEKPSALTKQVWFWAILVVVAAILIWLLLSGSKRTRTPTRSA